MKKILIGHIFDDGNQKFTNIWNRIMVSPRKHFRKSRKKNYFRLLKVIMQSQILNDFVKAC